MKMSPSLIPYWIHSLDDYRRMFNLEDADLGHTILDYAAGFSSVNAEMTHLGCATISTDPAYGLSLSKLAECVKTSLGALTDRLERRADLDEEKRAGVLSNCDQASQVFLTDYEAGLAAGRYQLADLPSLPFKEKQFKLALCAHLAFSNESGGGAGALISELCRVSEEVRVFPLLDGVADVGSALGEVMLSLQQQNFGVELREVPYQALEGHNAMLRIWTKECAVDLP